MNVLAIGAHPDDVEFACAGTLAKHKDNGDKVHLFHFTLGARVIPPPIRIEEAINASKILDVDSVKFGNVSVYNIYAVKHDFIHVMEQVIKEIKPKRVYSPFPHDTHQVHRVVAKCCDSAVRYIDEVFHYELPSTINFQPTVFVDISDKINLKIKCLQQYKSQMDKHYLQPEAIKTIAHHRYLQAWFDKTFTKDCYAEAFSVHRIKRKTLNSNETI